MKGKMKKIISILLSLSLMLGLTTGIHLTAFADDMYPLWIGGVQVTPGTLSGDGWSYEPLTNTLTLSGCSINTVKAVSQYVTAKIYYEGNSDLIINLPEGQTTTITNTDTSNDVNPYGIFCTSGVTFSGNGKLVIESRIGIYANGVTIGSGEINLTCVHAGISVPYSGTFTITGGKVTATASGSANPSGIEAGIVSITGGEVTASGVWTGIHSFADVETGISISGGTVEASANKGMYAHSNISISGGSVVATGNGTVTSYGIGTNSDSKTVSIGSGINAVTLVGTTQALYGTLSTSLTPTVYTDTDGTNVAGYSREQISDYKKMVFTGYKALDTTGDTTPVTISLPNEHTAPEVGDTLTVSCAATDLTYQWYRGDTAIENATNKTYTITTDDIGSTIKVVVKQTKNSEGGNYASGSEPTKASAATAAVVKKTAAELTEENARSKIQISYIDESVGLATSVSGYQISSSNTTYTAVTSLTDILDGEGTPTIYVRSAETSDTAAGAWVAVTLTARPSAPSGLTVKSYAESSTSQGTVTVPATDDSTKIEYKLDDSNVTTWTETSTGDLSWDPGTYLFRKKATASVPAGKTTRIEVGVKTDIVLPDAPADGSTVYLKYTGSEQTLLSISLPDTYEGCTVQYSKDGSSWDTTQLKADAEGSYNVYYKIDGGVKYNSIASRHVTVVISSRIPLAESSTPLKIKKGDAVLGDTVPVVGDTLTADCSATDLLYQWYRDGEPISEATSATYILTKEDYGKSITVQVTQTKDVSGNAYAAGQEPTLTSTETKAVAAPVAMGGKGYLSIADALTDANGEETIVLNKNFESDVSIESGKNITLDLNGCTLTGNVSNSGTLTIKDSSGSSGKLTGTIETSGGDTVIESGRFDRAPSDPQNDGTVTIKSGYFKEKVAEAMLAGEDYKIEEYSSGGSFTPAWADTGYSFRVVEISSYTVVFDSNGGSGKMADQTVSRNVATKLNANAFTNDGYVFTGWNTKKDGSGTSYKDKAEVTLKENLTLYAQWEESKNHNHLPLKEVPETEPKCEEEGNKHYYECETCGKIFEDAFGQVELTRDEVILKAIGHKWDSGEVTKEPTYYEDGIKTYTCLNDPSHTKEEVIPKKTRSYDSSSSDSDSDDSGSGSSSSSTTKAESQSKADQVNNVTSFTIPENHQVESGLPLSDIGGNWGNSVNADTWTYTKSDGTLAKSEWMNLEYNGLRYWYYFDNDANMRTSWFDYNNERFYLMPEKDGWRGRMATGWKNIENKWYYFEITPGSSQGRLYRSTVTPDGHIVGADGVWNGIGATPVGQE